MSFEQPNPLRNEISSQKSAGKSSMRSMRDAVPQLEFGFAVSNRPQLLLLWLQAVLIGLSLRLTVFPDALIATRLGLSNYTRQTSFLVSFGFTKALSNLLVGGN
jgi:hypothetical protein